MGWGRRLRRLVALTAGLLMTLFVVAQTGFGQRLLFDAIASAASGPDRTLRLSGPSGWFPTDLRLQRIEIADAKGVWLSANDVALTWSFLPLLAGRLDVAAVHAARLEIDRTPEASTGASTAAPGDGSDLPPLRLAIDSLVIDELRLGSALAAVESRWRIEGSARLDGLSGDNSLSLTAVRSDGASSRLALRARYEGPRGVLSGDGDFEEGEGGVLAALLGRPDLPRTSGQFSIQATKREGEGRVTIEAGDALHISGSGRMREQQADRRIAVSLEVRGGRLPNATLAAALARPATLQIDATWLSNGLVDLHAARLESAPLTATARGRYAPGKERVQLDLSASGADPAALATIVPGAGWRDLRLEARVDGSLRALEGTLVLHAADLRTSQVAAQDVDLTAAIKSGDLSDRPTLGGTLHGTMGGLTWRGDRGELNARAIRLKIAGERAATGRIVLSSFDVASSLANVTASGALETDGRVAATAMLDAIDLSALKPFVDRPIAGAGRAELRLSGTRERPVVTLDATVRDAVVADVPPALLAAPLRATASGTFDRRACDWRLESLSLSAGPLAVRGKGAGRCTTGTADLAVSLADLATLGPRYAGSLTGNIHVEAGEARNDIRLKATIAQATIDGTAIERLDLDAALDLRRDGLDGTLQLGGRSGDQPLRATGRISATAGERLSIPVFEASLGSTTLSVRDLVVDRTSATGSARLVVGDLRELSALTGQKMAGRLELTARPDPASRDGAVKLTLRGSDLALDARGIASLTGEATLADPLGRATFDATLTAGGVRGIADIRALTLKASGDRARVAASVDVSGPGLRVASAFKAARVAGETTIDVESMKGTYGGRPFALAQAAQIRQSGERTAVAPVRLSVGGGQVRIAGSLDARDSDLTVDLTALPLAELANLAGLDTPVTGTLQGQLHLRGARAAPQIEATYALQGARLRSLELASVPALGLTGKASLSGRDVAADATLTAGGNTLALAASARLPDGGGAPDGQVTVKGPVDLAIFAALVGPDIQRLGGRATVDVAIASRGGRPTGTGSVRLEDVRLAVPSEGLVLTRGTGLVRLVEDRVVIERLVFPAVGSGEVTMQGDVRLDQQLALPVDLRLETRRARLANRRDLVAEVTSSLHLSGSVAEGLTLQGPIRIDRAEISTAIGDAARAIPSVPVREIGAGAPKAARTATPSRPLALDLKVSAPQAVFVRGKGLEAEVQGDLEVGGTSAAPSITGGLQLRRGTFTLLGRQLRFTRGTVTFVNANRIVPLLDLVASGKGGDVTIEVKLSGSASEPKIVLSSTPALPQDEIMAQFLFGKGTNALGPTQLLQVAEAAAELTGAVSSGGAIDKLRRGLGLDQLGIGAADQGSTSTRSSGVNSAGVEGGRYVAPGVFVGGRQGLDGESRGVVQIEVIPHVKIEAEVGTRSTGRAGIALEYDY
ncbi:MAG: translocation/assembly module TamB domain-containing protein [Alphaproteobacteria bacterium]|nr:translocation/assembly module TamB domain-containing protein [Alphaproteobacteria bacterium]